jgi:hypothetical protein
MQLGVSASTPLRQYDGLANGRSRRNIVTNGVITEAASPPVESHVKGAPNLF